MFVKMTLEESITDTASMMTCEDIEEMIKTSKEWSEAVSKLWEKELRSRFQK